MAFIDDIDDMVPNPACLWRAAQTCRRDAMILRDGGCSWQSVAGELEKGLRSALKACLAQEGRLFDVNKSDSLFKLAGDAGVQEAVPQALQGVSGPLEELSLSGDQAEVVLAEANSMLDSLFALRADDLLPSAPSGPEQARLGALHVAASKQVVLSSASEEDKILQEKLRNEGLDSARRLAPVALELYPGAELYLFGSRVKGYAEQDSDIDVAVILPAAGGLPDPQEQFDKRCALYEAASAIDDRLSPVVVSIDSSPGFVRTVLLTGTRIA